MHQGKGTGHPTFYPREGAALSPPISIFDEERFRRKRTAWKNLFKSGDNKMFIISERAVVDDACDPQNTYDQAYKRKITLGQDARLGNIDRCDKRRIDTHIEGIGLLPTSSNSIPHFHG